ncbi:hypothetical protein [Dactylosporangium sp. CS-033363]|uniref:hypothetical protein n=1 Tax=Dactylosporangium sp. CS-033363 TaxID=3239935 RepID=UPI003D91B650
MKRESQDLQLRADADVRAGLEQFERGRGASAVILLDRAITGYLTLLRASGRSRGREVALLFSRAQLDNAEVLMRYGDPQLAAAAADLGFRGYVGQHRTRGWAVAEMGDLAARASAILARTGRLTDAVAADELAIKAYAELADAPRTAAALTLAGLHLLALADDRHREQASAHLGDARAVDAKAARAAQDEWERVRDQPPPLTLAQALWLVPEAEGLPDAYRDPAPNLVSPSGRTYPHLATIDAAKLAAIAERLLPGSPAEGLRIGLEAHYLYAIGAEAGPLDDRTEAEWTGLVDALRIILVDDDPPLAEDLTQSRERG